MTAKNEHFSWIDFHYKTPQKEVTWALEILNKLTEDQVKAVQLLVDDSYSKGVNDEQECP